MNAAGHDKYCGQRVSERPVGCEDDRGAQDILARAPEEGAGIRIGGPVRGDTKGVFVRTDFDPG